MAARIALMLSAAFLCLVLGLVSAPAPPPVVLPSHPLHVAGLRLDPAGVETASAAAALAGAAPRPPAAPSAARAPAPRVLTYAPPPPPRPPEADTVLRSSVAAVTEDGGRLSLVLAGAGRRLREGDAFMGWKVASVSRAGAVLRKGDARREVSFFAPGSGTRGTTASAAAASFLPPPAPGPRPAAPMPAAPTAAEYFRGFKG